jgi:uncharacterized membrane protein YuzA (DUF378 family)
MRRALVGFALLVAIVWPGVAVAQRSPARGLHADRFDVELSLQPDGAVQVVETITFRFSGETFHEVERRIPTRFTDGLTGVEAWLDNQILREGRGEGQARIRHRPSDVRVLWQFSETTDTTHRYTLRYRAQGVLRLDNGRASLAWDVLPTRHRYGISEAQVIWRVPPGAISLAGPALEAEGWAWMREEQADGGTTWVARKSALAVDETARLTDEFDAATLAVGTPQWQVDEERARQFAPAFLVGAAVILVMGGGMIGMAVVRYHRPHADARSLEPAPRGSLPPAMATGILSNRPRIGFRQQLATVFDLLARGRLILHETSSEGTGKKRTFEMEMPEHGRRGAPLRPHEQTVLETLRPHMTEGHLPLKGVQKQLLAGQRTFADAVRSEIREAGLVDGDRRAMAQGLAATGAIALLLGFVGFITFALVLPWLGDAALLVPSAVGVVGLAAVIAAESVPTFSQTGATLRAQWVARAAWIRAASRTTLTSDVVDEWLPVAIGLGVGRAFTRHAPAVRWLEGVTDPHGALLVIVAATSHGAPGGGAHTGGGTAGGGGFSGAR